MTEAADILSILGLPLKAEKNITPPSPSSQNLSNEDKKVLDCLDLTPRHSDELVRESGLTPMELSVILLHLELQGFAEKLPGGRYIRGRHAT